MSYLRQYYIILKYTSTNSNYLIFHDTKLQFKVINIYKKIIKSLMTSFNLLCFVLDLHASILYFN